MIFDLMFASGVILKIPSIGNMDQKCYLEAMSMLIFFPFKTKVLNIINPKKESILL